MNRKLWIAGLVCLLFSAGRLGPARAEMFGNSADDSYMQKGPAIEGRGESGQVHRNPLDELNWLRSKAAREEIERRRLDAALQKANADLEAGKAQELKLTTQAELLKARVHELEARSGNPEAAQGAAPIHLKKGYYEVKAGDSLWKIAKRPDVLGNPLKWSELYYTNKAKLDNPNKIFPGQVLKMPEYYEFTESPTAASAADAEESAEN